MTTYVRILSTVILLSLAAVGLAGAEIPHTINYQGSLKQAAGTPVDGTVSMSFALYDSLSGGTELWSNPMNVEVHDGIYSVVLDLSAAELAFDQPYFLEVSVDNTTLEPRQALTSVPYALTAAGVDHIRINGTTPTITLEGRLVVSPEHEEPFSSVAVFESTNEEPPYISWNHSRSGTETVRYGYIQAGDFGEAPLFLFAADNEADFAMSGGNVGIGTLEPSYPLDVNGAAHITRETGTTQGTGVTHFSGNVITLNATDGEAINYPYIEWRRNGGRGAFLGWGKHQQYFELQLENNNAFSIGGGSVGIGTKTPQYKLDVAGQIRANNVSVSSDLRWKTEIATLNDSLERVTQLRGVSFSWKDTAKGEGPQIGLIAQEVEQIFPELVSTDGEGYKSVSYDKLVAPLIEAVKTLKAENEELKRRLEALEVAVNQNN